MVKAISTHMHRVGVVSGIISSVAFSFMCDDRCLPALTSTEHDDLHAGVHHNCERGFSG